MLVPSSNGYNSTTTVTALSAYFDITKATSLFVDQNSADGHYYPIATFYSASTFVRFALALGYTSQTDAQAALDTLVASFNDSASAGSTTTTVTIPEITITAESAPSV